MKDDNDKLKNQRLIPSEELDFVSDSKLSILLDTPRFSSTILYTFVLFCIIFFIWADWKEIEEVTHAQGKVIPSSHLQVIQNLEGGIVKNILVSEGDIVEKGQVLLKIDDTQSSSAYEHDRSKYFSLIARSARLRSQIDNKEKIEFSSELKDHPELIQREEALSKVTKNAFESTLQTLRRSQQLAESELKITRPLVDEGALSELELLRLEREVNDLDGKIKDKVVAYENEAVQEYTETQAELSTLAESIRALKDRMVRTIILSPVRGIIHDIHVNTVGGVIKPGMDIMEIVPLESKLIVEAQIKPSDIAFISPEQKATVKFTAYDSSIYGGLSAAVKNISADTIVDEKGESFYKITLQTDRNYLGTKEHPLPIISGMVVTVDIVTGEKTILDYILKPLIKAQQKALRER